VSLQAALAFLGAVRRDEDLRERLGGEVSYAALTEIAAGAGFEFTEEELQRAHALDWRMRWARYQGEA
jgi:predicted ribosomally synthesized peptide with nif11-like leader